MDPATLRLEALRGRFPEAVPQGFVLTGAGCRHFFQHGDLQSEINRRIQAAGGLAPMHLAKLSRQLGQLVEATPLPEELSDAILTEVARLRQGCDPASMRLLLRGRVWPPEAPTEEGCGMVLWGPPVPLGRAGRGHSGGCAQNSGRQTARSGPGLPSGARAYGGRGRAVRHLPGGGGRLLGGAGAVRRAFAPGEPLRPRLRL